MSESRLILHGPGMHPETITPKPAPGVRCLNPGLAEGGEDTYLPEGLPLDRRAASAWLSQAMGFGGQFRRSGEISALGAAGIEDFYDGTSNSIRGQLMGYGKGKVPDPALAAQMTLLLAYKAERELLDLTGMGAGLVQAWQRFRGSLGLLDDDEDETGEAGLRAADAGLGVIDAGLEDIIPWKPVMEAFLELAPAEALLFVDRPDIAGEWLEAGLHAEYPSRDQWDRFHPEWPESLPGRIGVLKAAGTLLTGLGKAVGGEAGGRLSAEREIIVWTDEID